MKRVIAFLLGAFAGWVLTAGVFWFISIEMSILIILACGAVAAFLAKP